jgi:hypothetical protein
MQQSGRSDIRRHRKFRRVLGQRLGFGSLYIHALRIRALRMPDLILYAVVAIRFDGLIDALPPTLSISHSLPGSYFLIASRTVLLTECQPASFGACTLGLHYRSYRETCRVRVNIAKER